MVASPLVVLDVPDGLRARAMGVIELTWAGGLLLGAPAAGWLIDRQGWASPFWLLAVLAAASIPVLLVVMDRDEVGGEHYEGRWFDIGTPERLAEVNDAVINLQ